MERQNSITSFFLTLSVSILLMIFAAITTMIYGLNAQNRLHDRFITRLTAAETVQAALVEVKETFSVLGRSWSVEDYDNYIATCFDLDQMLKQYRKYCQDSPATLNYIRRLDNFNGYQQERIMQAEAGDKSLYETYQYVLNGIDLHQQQTIEMAHNDTIYARADYELASQQITRNMMIIMLILILSALFMGGLLLQFAFRTKQTLKTMTAYFTLLSKRVWSTSDLPLFRYREFTLIAQTANWLKQEIKSHVSEVETKAKLQKQLDEERLLNEKQHGMLITAQMSALRAQINPHFLFNALNLIGVTSLLDKPDAVMQLVEATGQILRYSLYHKGIMTTLEAELEIVGQYLFLQKCRFGDAVSFQIYNELEGEDYEIPTMSIQPLVENCFKHGFANKKKLNIDIAAILTDELVTVSIEDDGIGFESDNINTESTDGIGLMNIKKRLALLYGDQEEWLQIKSKPGEYTRVTLMIPQRGKADEGTYS